MVQLQSATSSGARLISKRTAPQWHEDSIISLATLVSFRSKRIGQIQIRTLPKLTRFWHQAAPPAIVPVVTARHISMNTIMERNRENSRGCVSAFGHH